jgi:hypothetical protein
VQVRESEELAKTVAKQEALLAAELETARQVLERQQQMAQHDVGAMDTDDEVEEGFNYEEVEEEGQHSPAGMNFMSTGWQGLPTNLQSVGVGIGADLMSTAPGEERGDFMQRAAASQTAATVLGDRQSLPGGFGICQGSGLGSTGTRLSL